MALEGKAKSLTNYEMTDGQNLREGALSEGTHMLFVINPDLLWLALGFIFSMAGMLATYPE